MDIILCIDDMPIRYRRLRRLCKNTVIVTTCRMEDVIEYLRGSNQIYGVALDHDMPFQDGLWFANNYFRELNIPVVVTSLNSLGARDIMLCLQAYETPCLELPCDASGWETQALKFFRKHN